MQNSCEEEIKNSIIKNLKTIQDSEVPTNIYDLGLIYNIDLEKADEKFNANIEMTVINSRCASTKSFTDLIKEKVQSVDEIETCNVKFVFSPKWDVKMISENGLNDLRKAANQ